MAALMNDGTAVNNSPPASPNNLRNLDNNLRSLNGNSRNPNSSDDSTERQEPNSSLPLRQRVRQRLFNRNRSTSRVAPPSPLVLQHEQEEEKDEESSMSNFLVFCSALGAVWFIISLIFISLLCIYVYTNCWQNGGLKVKDPNVSSPPLSDETPSSCDTCMTQLEICNKRFDKERDISATQSEEMIERNDVCNIVKNELSSCQTSTMYHYILMSIPWVFLAMFCACVCRFGMKPSHYVVDNDGRPQAITSSSSSRRH